MTVKPMRSIISEKNTTQAVELRRLFELIFAYLKCILEHGAIALAG